MKVRLGIRKVNQCQHPGCQKEGLPCYSASGDEEADGFYCFDHCQAHGFSYPRDLSRGEMEFFGFTDEPCGNCREDLEAEFGEDEGDFDHEQGLKYFRGELPEEVSHCDPFPEKISLRCYYLKAKSPKKIPLLESKTR